jgi:hypothetical protein
MNIAEYASLRQAAFERLQQANPKKQISHAELVAEIERLLSSAG